MGTVKDKLKQYAIEAKDNLVLVMTVFKDYVSENEKNRLRKIWKENNVK